MAGDVSNCRDGCPGTDVAALAFRGRKACLNFADSTWSFIRKIIFIFLKMNHGFIFLIVKYIFFKFKIFNLNNFL